MPAIAKPSGPPNTVRPFIPVMGDKDPAERIAHALEHIAVSLAALDHNVEQLTGKMSEIAHVLPRLMQAR